MMNLRECVWYLKSEFIMSCLKGLKKPVLFQQEYEDVDMSWIDSFTDFSIHAVEYGIDKYGKSRTGKSLEMILLSVTLDDDVSKVTNEDHVRFLFKEVMRRVFHKYKKGGISRGKMLLDFLETKQQHCK